MNTAIVFFIILMHIRLRIGIKIKTKSPPLLLSSGPLFNNYSL